MFSMLIKLQASGEDCQKSHGDIFKYKDLQHRAAFVKTSQRLTAVNVEPLCPDPKDGCLYMSLEPEGTRRDQLLVSRVEAQS